MGLRDIGETLPPGFRFYPSDEELVCHYLYKKIANEEVLKGTLVDIDLHTCEPWQLPEVAKLNSSEWYFFSFRDRKYATGFRTNRATTSGYWKATGKDRTVIDPRSRTVVGMRKTLVFYRNRAPNGIKTGWIMHEFRLENPLVPPKEDWVLCRVFHKGKGENNYRYDPQNLTESTLGPNSPILASSPPIDQTLPPLINHGSHDHNTHLNLNLSSLNPNFLHLSQEEMMIMNEPPPSINDDHILECCKGGGDDYGFLFDLGFDEDRKLGDNGLDEIGFDDDDDGLVFL